MKTFIKNRKNQNLSVLVEKPANAEGLAFVMHGLGGQKNAAHIRVMVDALLAASYTIVSFDTTNSYGESDGNYADATTTNYYEDLEDILSWAATQEWYQEPFILAGHSLGAMCITLYAEKYPDRVKALAPISLAVSGKLSLETPQYANGVWQDWQRTGWYERQSGSDPSVIKRLKWSHMEDRLKYDTLLNIKQLTMPILMVVGENDDATPVDQQRHAYDALPGNRKELHTITGAPHTFRDKSHLDQLRNIFNNWLTHINREEY